MTPGITLVIETGRGEQVIRQPLATDAIGATLRDAFGTGTDLPGEMVVLLRRLDSVRDARK